MKILIFNEYYYPYEKGGAEVSTRLLAESLCRLGHDVFVASSCDRTEKTNYNGVTLFYVKTNPIYWDGNNEKKTIVKKILWHIVDMNNLFVTSSIENLIQDVQPDIIHTNNLSHFSCRVWKVAHEKNIPICHTLRDYYLICHKCTLYKGFKSCKQRCLGCRFSSYYKKRYSKYVNAVVGISSHILNRHLLEGLFDEACETRVIHNPVLTKEVCLKRKVTKKIGFIGSLKESKGIEILIKNFIACNRVDYSLVIAGTGADAYVQHLKSISRDSQNVQFLGRMDATEFYNQIDLLVVPSLWEEPFGRIVVEAIACGVPVLASNRGGISEILKNRKEGLLFNIEDPESLKNKLLDFMDGKISFDFSEVKSFLGIYDTECIALEYENIYNQLLT